jgi:hypothetical protein
MRTWHVYINYQHFIEIVIIVFSPALLSFLLNKRIRNGLHSVDWADEDDGGAAANHETQVPRVLGKLVRVVGVSEDDDIKRRH